MLCVLNISKFIQRKNHKIVHTGLNQTMSDVSNNRLKPITKVQKQIDTHPKNIVGNNNIRALKILK